MILDLNLIDLRFLQLAGVVDVERLPLGEDVEDLRAGFAVAVAGVLCADEWLMHLGTNRRRVDVEDSGLEIAHRGERAVDVLSVD